MLYYVQVDSIERLPDVHGREEILKVHTKDTLLGAGIRLRGIYISPLLLFLLSGVVLLQRRKRERQKP